MQISKKSQYGLRAMVLLAKAYKSKQICSIKKISDKEGIPFDFLEKIMGELEQSDLVKAKKGAGGGYILAKNPSKITAKDIVQTLEKTVPVNCLLCDKNKGCLSKNVWTKMEKTLNKTLKGITLKELIE